jgi:hypothetical protein
MKCNKVKVLKIAPDVTSSLVAQPNGTRPGPCRFATWVPQGPTAGVPADCDSGIQKGPVRDSWRLTPDGNRLDTVIVTRRVPWG